MAPAPPPLGAAARRAVGVRADGGVGATTSSEPSGRRGVELDARLSRLDPGPRSSASRTGAIAAPAVQSSTRAAPRSRASAQPRSAAAPRHARGERKASVSSTSPSTSFSTAVSPAACPRSGPARHPGSDPHNQGRRP